MDTNKQIAKAMLNKNFVEAKELVFKSLYAKASLAMDEARYDVANSVFNEAKTAPDTGVPAGASEDKFKAARATIKKAGYKAKLGKGVPAGAMKEEAELDEMAITDARAREHASAIDRAAYTNPNITNSSAFNKFKKELASKKLYGRGGKIVKGKRKPVKEEAELDEMAVTAARAKEHERKIDKADEKAWRYTNPSNRQGMWKDGKAKSSAHIKKGKGLEKAYDKAVAQSNKEVASKKLYGRGGKVVKKAGKD